MCTDLDDAESMYGKPYFSLYSIYYEKNKCPKCKGSGYVGVIKGTCKLIQCKECDGYGKIKHR